MRRAGLAAAPSTPPRRRSGTTQLQTTPAAAAVSKTKPSKDAFPTTPSKQPTKLAPSSPTKRPSYTSPSQPHTKPTTSPSRLPVRRSPQRSPTSAHSKHQPTISTQLIQPATAPQPADVQIWSFEEKLGADDDDQRQQHSQHSEQPARTIPLSALFAWPSTDSTVLSFQSLSAYELPALPSYDSIPALCTRLQCCDGACVDASYGAVCGLRDFEASDLLASPYASLVVSSLVAAVLPLSTTLQPVSKASLLLLADLFDAAHSSRTAAELYLELVQHVIDKWHSAVHWPGAHAEVWLEEPERSPSNTSLLASLNEDTEAVHTRRSHAHLTRVFRFISIMQRELPTQWVYFSPSTHHSLLNATLRLYATALSPPPASLLSPAHMLAIVDPTCSWLPLWLYQLPTRKLIMQLLTSADYAPLLDWMAAIAVNSASQSAASLIAVAGLDEVVPVCVSSAAVLLMRALQRARCVQCMLQHGSGRLVLKTAWARAGLECTSQEGVRDEVQRLQLAARTSLPESNGIG